MENTGTTAYIDPDPTAGYTDSPRQAITQEARTRQRRRRRWIGASLAGLLMTTGLVIAVLAGLAMGGGATPSTAFSTPSPSAQALHHSTSSATTTTTTTAPSGLASRPSAPARAPAPAPTTTVPPSASVAGSTPTPNGPSLSTTVTAYNPWTATGTLSLSFHVLGQLSGGSCLTQLSSPNVYGQTTVPWSSIADSSNENAWRCSTGNEIYDPCFAPPGSSNVNQLACAVTPYDQHDVYLLALSQPLASSSTGFEPTGGWPLELALSNGVECEVIQGTASIPGGNYGCTSGSASNPNTSSEPWTVRYWAAGADTPVIVTVTTAWE